MFPDTCGIRLFLDPAVVVGQPFVADLLHHVAQQLDLRQQGVDVGLRDLEIGVVARFDVGALQQVEQPFSSGVSRGNALKISGVCFLAAFISSDRSWLLWP